MIISVCGPFELETRMFYQWVTVGGVKKLMDFDHEIVWQKASESTVLYRHGGKVLKQGACYNDYYGFMTSVGNAIESAKEFAANYLVTPDSSLSVEVQTVVKRNPLIRTDRCRTSDLSNTQVRHDFEMVPSTWLIPVDGEFRTLESIIVSDTIPWSSKG
jgi:hypothetical protein